MMGTLRRILATAVLLGLAVPFGASADPISPACPIGAPFTVAPISADAKGNSASAHTGCFRKDGGAPVFQFFLGTEPAFPGPGTLTLDFAAPFTDGPGDDFAVQTGSFWGTAAADAHFQFLLNGVLQGSFTATLAASQLFTFNLPAVTANQIRVINVTPDPPGVNDLGTMSFVHAAVTSSADPVPEPGSLLLLGTGLLGLTRKLRRGRREDV